MLEFAMRIASRLFNVTEAIAKSPSRQLGKDESGSALIEYALFTSGLGVTMGGVLAALGIDVGFLYQMLDTSMCEHFSLREICSIPP